METKSVVCTSSEQNNTNAPPLNIRSLSVQLQDELRVLLILHQHGGSIVLIEGYGESTAGYDVYGSYLHFTFNSDQWNEHHADGLRIDPSNIISSHTAQV